MNAIPLPSSASPRLRIHHLLLMMTTMALVASWRLALSAKLAEIPRQYRSSNSPVDILRISLTQIICYGGMLAVVIVSIAWKARHRTAPWQSGQWLAALGVVGFLHDVAFTLHRFVTWFGPPEDGPTFTLPLRREFAYFFACAVVIGYAALRSKCGWVWRVALGVLAAQLLVYSLSNGALILAGLFNWEQPTADHVFSSSVMMANYARKASLCAVTIAAAVDVFRSLTKSWAHWTGAVLWLALGWSSEVARILEFGLS